MNWDKQAFVSATSRVLLILLGMLAAIAIGIFAWTTLLRIIYPNEIMWMEGGILDHVIRITDGDALYAEPSWNFSALIYMPLYYYMSAAFSLVVGPGFAAIRLVSVVASIFISLLIAMLTFRATGQRMAAALAAAFFIAAAKATDFSLDTGRVDSLFVALTLGYFYFAHYRPDFQGQVIAALLGIAALLTKQTAVIACAPVALFLLLTGSGKIRFIVPVLGIVGALAALATLELTSDGWFSFYVFELGGTHNSQWHKLTGVVLNYFVIQFCFLLLMALIVLVPLWRETRTVDFYPWLLVCTLTFAGLFPYVHTGSAPNILMPLQAGMALLLGICLGSTVRGRSDELVVLLLAFLQFVFMFYDPRQIVPSSAWSLRVDQYRNCLMQLPQPILNTRTGYIWRQTNTTQTAHESAVADIFRAGDGPERSSMLNEIQTRIRQQHYGVLVLGKQMTTWLSPVMADQYIDSGFMFDAGDESVPSDYYNSRVFLSADYIALNGMPEEPICDSLADLAQTP